MKNERQVALEILLEVEDHKAYSNITINKYLRKYQIDEGAFIREMVYGVIENKIYLDYTLSFFVTNGLKKLKSEVLIILRMGLYQLIFLSGTPAYAAVNESVQLTRRYSKRHAGFVNAVMRNYSRKKDEIGLPDREKEFIKHLSVKYSYEPWMIEEWLKVYSEEFTEALLVAGNMTPEVTLRVNRLKTDAETLSTLLSDRGFEVRKGNYLEEALIVKGKGLINNDLFEQGFYQIQDESSMLAVKALDPRPNDFVVDVCAAPGGKSLFAAELMKNKGRLYAYDIHPHKIELLNKKAKSHGAEIIESKIQDALVLDKNLEKKAQRVLADVPCSGLGVIRRKPEIKYTKKREELEQFADIQYRILKNASTYVKRDGVLVYSTCTISKKENEEVIKRFMTENKGFSVVKPDEKLFEKLGIGDDMLQLYPNVQKTDGFFICKMIKKE